MEPKHTEIETLGDPISAHKLKETDQRHRFWNIIVLQALIALLLVLGGIVAMVLSSEPVAIAAFGGASGCLTLMVQKLLQMDHGRKNPDTTRSDGYDA